MSTTIRIPRKIENLGASSQFTAARFEPRHRIPEVTVHPVLNGDHRYLRALRAAEMAAWDASLPREIAKNFAESVARSEAQ
jgi:hypothetical protein